MDTIFCRSSVRAYDTKRNVSAQCTDTILQAAMQAPSAINRQPWEFWVVRNPDIQKVLSECHPYAKPAASAPVVILVAGNRNRMSDYWQQDLAACTQNILLEATHLGLGGVWMGIAPIPSRMAYVSEILKLSDEIVPFALVAIGYPAKEPQPHSRFVPEYIHYI